MILYHGSYMEIAEPDLKHSRTNVDFGCGLKGVNVYERKSYFASEEIQQGCCMFCKTAENFSG